jgi:TatD DNase family protein
MNQAKYVNAHTHHLPPEGVLAVVNLHRDAGSVPPTGYFSAGIHPWLVRPELGEREFGWLEKMLEAPNVVAVGECGLDKLAKTPWALQMHYFEKQILIAETSNKPMIIHNVRAGSDLLQLKKQLAPGAQWLLHGYHGSSREAELLMMQGCLFSFGKHLFQATSKASGVCKTLPIECILPETDDSNILIGKVIEAIAEIRGADPLEIAQQLHRNFVNLFNIKC